MSGYETGRLRVGAAAAIEVGAGAELDREGAIFDRLSFGAGWVAHALRPEVRRPTERRCAAAFVRNAGLTDACAVGIARCEAARLREAWHTWPQRPQLFGSVAVSPQAVPPAAPDAPPELPPAPLTAPPLWPPAPEGEPPMANAPPRPPLVPPVVAEPPVELPDWPPFALAPEPPAPALATQTWLRHSTLGLHMPLP